MRTPRPLWALFVLVVAPEIVGACRGEKQCESSWSDSKQRKATSAQPEAARGAGESAESADAESAIFTMTWNNRVAGVIRGDWMTCEVMMVRVDDRITGTFKDPLPGDVGNRQISGQFIPGRIPLILLTRTEPEYIVAYQLRRISFATFEGTWSDNKGGSGDVSLSVEIDPNLARWFHD